MLEKVRKPGKVKSVYRFVGYALLAIICLSFAFIGLNTDMGGGFVGGGAAAIVNDTPIPIRKFQEQVERETRQMGEAFNQLPAAQRRMYERSLKERTLNSLVATEVLYQKAQHYGFRVPDLEVRDQVMALPYFQEDGRFSRQKYLSLLEANRMDPGQFEADIRRDITISGVRDGFTRAFKKPSVMSKLEHLAKETKLELRYIKFGSEDLDMSAFTSSEALEKYAVENATEIEKYYQDHPTEFEIPKEVNARHILVKTGGDSGRTESQALEEIQGIKAGLTVENFADVAKEKSEDLGSKVKGGSLGFFGTGRMVPEFEKAAFEAKVGDISEPVKTQFGYHLILVDAARGGGSRGFDEVRWQIAKNLIEKQGREQAMEEIESVVKAGEDLSKTIKAYGLKWESTGEFSLDQTSVPQLGDVNEIVTVAMSLSPGETAKRLVRGAGKAHIVQLKSLKTPSKTWQSDGGEPEAFSYAGMESLNRWAKDLRESARVQLNSQILDL